MARTVHFYVFVLLAIIALSVTACLPEPSSIVNANNNPEGAVEVDRTFREFYQSLGGRDILGPAITDIFSYDTLQCQYTENALLCFNSLATDTERFTLYPLGEGFDVNDTPADVFIASDDDRVIDGIHIHEEFQPMYDQLFGARYVGRPLTQVRYNPLEQRIEQYFENVGFYRRVDDPEGDVHLLAYGVYACNASCRYKARQGSAVTSLQEQIDLPFLPVISKMSSPDVFGEPLTSPFTYDNGLIQQVYENAVFVGNPGDPKTVHLLDVPIKLGYSQSEPGPQIYSIQDGMVFYPINGATGFHVPLVFDEFIVAHGGREFAGNPLSEVAQVDDKTYRQCFQNYCLDYIKKAPENQNVQMVAIGQDYLDSVNLSKDLVAKFDFNPQSVFLTINEKWAHVSKNMSQQIELLIVRSQDQMPLSNVEAKGIIILPDSSILEYNFEPTDENGHSAITLPPMKNVENGSVIAYKVCLNVPSDTPVCRQDSFLIWEH